MMAVSVRQPATSDEVARVRLRLGEELSELPEVAAAFLHGTFRDGLPFRDVDVAVFLQSGAEELREPWAWEARAAASLTRSVGLPVDVRVVNDAPLGLLFHATAGDLCWARDEEAVLDRVEVIRLRYYDFQPFAEKNLKGMLHG
jgi:predicted nucleotidyltransferase